MEVIDKNFELILRENPLALKEYFLILKLINLISALLVKWDMIIVEDYRYRLSRNSTNIKFLDLQIINSDLMTAETLWYASQAN